MIFLFTIFSIALAQEMPRMERYYIIKTDSGNMMIVGAGGTHVPENIVIEAPRDEKGFPYPLEAVEISEEIDAMGTKRIVATVDKVKVAEKIENDRLAKEAAETQKKDQKAALKTSLRKCTKANATTEEMRECLQTLIKHVVVDIDVDDLALKKASIAAKKK